MCGGYLPGPTHTNDYTDPLQDADPFQDSGPSRYGHSFEDPGPAEDPHSYRATRRPSAANSDQKAYQHTNAVEYTETIAHTDHPVL
jgi:hypothetical protein